MSFMKLGENTDQDLGMDSRVVLNISYVYKIAK